MDVTASHLRHRYLPVVLLVAYFGLQAGARMLHPGALELDEAEQALWAQRLAAGYGAQPPLYTWLQWAAFQVLGPSVLALALLKNVLLAATYAFVFLTARRMVNPEHALLAAGAMLFIPSIGWASQRDLTHTVLATCLAAATLYVAVRLIERRSVLLYAALGLTVGLGMLSKYNFAVFALALGLAIATARDTRDVLRAPAILVSALVAGLVVALHALWLVDHWHLAAAHTAGKLGIGDSDVLDRIKGLSSVSAAGVQFAVVPVSMVTLALGWGWWRTSRGAQAQALWVRYLICTLATLYALVLLGGASGFRTRWLQPMLFMIPLAVFTVWNGLLSSERLNRLRALLLGIALVYLAMAVSRPLVDGWRGRPDELNAPIGALAGALREAGYDGKAPIVTDVASLGGSLRLHFPDAPVRIWKDGPAPAEIAGPRLLVGVARQGADIFSRAGVATPRTISLAYEYAASEEAAYRFDLRR